MPAIDFPAAPAVNDEYSFEGRTWLWNGTGWEVKSFAASAGAIVIDGGNFANGSSLVSVATTIDGGSFS